MKTAAAILLSLGLTLCAAQNIPLPVIPGAAFNITEFGAVGDGKTLDTAAIQKTIDAAARAGGGTVLVPAAKLDRPAHAGRNKWRLRNIASN